MAKKLVYKNRKDKLLEALPKHNYQVAPAAREAGYSPMYAAKEPRKILKAALNHKERELAALPKEERETLAKKLGFTRQDIVNNIKWLAEQERDLGVRLKVLKPIAKDLGMDLSEDDANSTVVPVLNITVKEKTAQQSHIREGIAVESSDVKGKIEDTAQ